MPRFAVLSLLALCLGGCATAPPSLPASSPQLQSVITDVDLAAVTGAGFNGVVLVQEGGATAPLVRAYGTANFEQGKATAVDTRFQVGSITKWITSVAVLRLVDRGALQLDTPIGAYLPQMTASGASVTLRHLLSNTSGIPNDMAAAMKTDMASVLPNRPMARAALQYVGRAPAFAPGSRFEYVPSNWIIVGAILEQVTHKPFPQVLADEVFVPAGAASSGVPQGAFDKVPNAAQAYGAATPRTVKVSPNLDYIAASGTVYSIAADLARMAHAVYASTLLSPAARAELSRIMVADEHYALGGRVLTMTLGGKPRLVASESGVSGAFKSLLLHVHGEDKTVVILNNTDMQQSALAAMGQALLEKMTYR